MKKKYSKWTIIDWDGNPDLKLKCWRKSFGRGHVSIGIGDFKTIVYSHGDNSNFSLSSTRCRKAYGIPDQTEEKAKAVVDKNQGYYNYLDTGDREDLKREEEE